MLVWISLHGGFIICPSGSQGVVKTPSAFSKEAPECWRLFQALCIRRRLQPKPGAGSDRDYVAPPKILCIGLWMRRLCCSSLRFVCITRSVNYAQSYVSSSSCFGSYFAEPEMVGKGWICGVPRIIMNAHDLLQPLFFHVHQHS